jgi:hypothetical protein
MKDGCSGSARTLISMPISSSTRTYAPRYDPWIFCWFLCQSQAALGPYLRENLMHAQFFLDPCLRQAYASTCTQVANNARSSLFLRALSKVLERSMHLCGDTSCMDLAYSMAFR